jgi:hypothetical protein
MPLMVQPADRDHFVVVLLDVLRNSYKLVGYTGSLAMTDIANVVMNLANGHMVALPGASPNCFYISTTVAWIV